MIAAASPSHVSVREEKSTGAPWPTARRAQARYPGHEKRWGLTLHDLYVEGSSFCKLMVKGTVDGERATAAWFGRHLAMVRAASDEAPVPRLAPAAAVEARAPPPSSKLAREALTRWHDGATW
jgi:hypothetical protein